MKNIFCLLLIVVVFPASIFSQKIDNQLSAKEKRKGWILLFNGIDSEGWTTTNNKMVPAGWSIKDGLLSTVKGGNVARQVSMHQKSGSGGSEPRSQNFSKGSGGGDVYGAFSN